MTRKQEDFLKKYMNDEDIKILDHKGFNYVSSFINLIMQIKDCHFHLTRDATEKEIEEVEKIVNYNLKEYNSLCKDEYAYIDTVCYLPNLSTWYCMKQTWSKGMSDSLSYSHVNVFKNGKIFTGIYHVLIENGIYSISAFMDYLRTNNFDR